MGYSEHYIDYTVPFGYIELRDAFNLLGKVFFKEEWTDEEYSLIYIEPELRKILWSYKNTDLLEMLVKYFREKDTLLKQRKSKLTEAKEIENERLESLYSLLEGKQLTEKNARELEKAYLSHNVACATSYQNATSLLVRNDENNSYSLNPDGIKSYRRKIGVERLLRQIFHYAVKTILFDPDTGESLAIPSYKWLGNDYAVYFDSGEVRERGIANILGIILIGKSEFEENLKAIFKKNEPEVDLSEERKAISKTIQEIVALDIKGDEITREQRDELIKKVAVNCMVAYEENHKKLPTKGRLSKLVFEVLKKDYPRYCEFITAPETITRTFAMKDIEIEYAKLQNLPKAS